MNNRKKHKITYRPSKPQAILGGVVGILFVILGVFWAIPTFGLFGIVWTFMAGGIAGVNLGQAFGKSYMGPEIHIEDEGLPGVAPDPGYGAGSDTEARMQQLRTLYDRRLITPEEYEEKRKKIIEEL